MVRSQPLFRPFQPWSVAARSSATALALGLLTTACGGGADPCATQNGVLVCGTFGSAGYTADVSGRAVSWPPVAVADGRVILAAHGTGSKQGGAGELLEIAPDGALNGLTQTPGAMGIPSADAAGLYVISGDSAGTTLQALDPSSRTQRWSTRLQGTPVGAPPAISNTGGADAVFVATNDGGSGATIWRVNAATGEATQVHDGASPAVIAPDNTIRYLRAPIGRDSLTGTPMFGTLVAEDLAGKELWTHTEAAGIVDLSPGLGGETYVVTGTATGTDTHVLRRVDPPAQGARGLVAWTFHPDCGDCTVAAAPSATADTVYFPVWETRQTNPIDPLYALDARTGAQRWTYDGFDNVAVSVNGAKMMLPGAGDVTNKTVTRHHPAGRPVVAQDGTLFVASDGAVVALDKNGQLLGFAQYDASAGEVSGNEFLTLGKWQNAGVRPSPVLGPDGTLYVSDGSTVRAFHTGRPASTSAWVAPYGGPNNSSRPSGQ